MALEETSMALEVVCAEQGMHRGPLETTEELLTCKALKADYVTLEAISMTLEVVWVELETLLRPLETMEVMIARTLRSRSPPSRPSPR